MRLPLPMPAAAGAALLCATALTFTGCGRTPPDPPLPEPTTAAELAGDWAGTLSSPADDSYTVELTLADPLTKGQPGATVSYPGLGGISGCSGTWEFTGERKGSFTFAETITDGAGTACAPEGQITLTPSTDDTLEYLREGRGGPATGFLQQGKLPGS